MRPATEGKGGTARFALRHGRRGLVRVRLSARAQRVVRAKHRLAAVAAARATDAAGLTGTATRGLLVRPAAKRRQPTGAGRLARKRAVRRLSPRQLEARTE